MSDQAEARILRPANTLRDKVTGGDPTVKIVIDAATLARAQSTIDNMGDAYEADLKVELAALVRRYEAARADAGRRSAFLADVMSHCHEIRGQAGTFGYSLITEFANALYDFADDSSHVLDVHLDIIKAHIDVIQVALAGGLKGDGGDTGKELKTMLSLAIQKRG